jgi:hypothetical protein
MGAATSDSTMSSLDTRARSPAGSEAARIPAWYGTMLVAALLLVVQPYRGVRHDALAYLAQTLSRIDPRWWHADAYFAYGSQERYSLFSRLFAAPVQLLGIPAAEMLALTTGRIATFVALYLMVKSWTPLRRWMALATVAGFVHYYGGKTFAVLEPFVTGRTFAEPLGLLAIAAVLRRRKAWGALALAGAFLVHPLIALPVALALWVYLVVIEDRRWAWAAVLLLPVLGLARAGVAPFDGLLSRYDDQWFALIGVVNSLAFVSEWPFAAYVAIVSYAVVIWAATWGRRDPLARFSRIAALLGPVCCALSFWLADWVHDILLTQLQFWRVIWIGELLSVLWVPVLVLDQWRRSEVGRLAAAATCAGLPVVQDDLGMYGWVVLLWMTLWIVLSLRAVPIGRRVLRLAFAATVLMGLVAVGQHCWESLYMLRADVRGFALSYPASIPFRVAMLTLPAFGGLLLAWQQPRWRPACAAAAVVLLAASAWQTDQRSAFTRFVESASDAQRPFQSEIPPTARVHWVGKGIAPVWILLRRAGFGEVAQFTGSLFNRGTAMAAIDAWPFMAANTQRIEHCNHLQSWMSRDYDFADCEVPLAQMVGYCTGPGAHPDFIVSPVDYPLPQQARWVFRPADGGTPSGYILYSCAAIRSASPITSQ